MQRQLYRLDNDQWTRYDTTGEYKCSFRQKSVISFLFKCYKPSDSQHNARPVYNKADLDNIRVTLKSKDWDSSLENKNTKEIWQDFKQTIYASPVSDVINLNGMLHESFADASKLHQSALMADIDNLINRVQGCIVDVKDRMTLNKL